MLTDIFMFILFTQNLDIGLLFGILALVFSSVFRNTRQTSELQGRIQSSEIFRPVSKYSTLTGNLVDHKIYRLKGSIDYASSETLLASLVQKGTIILDFGAVSYIDCIGRNELTKMFKKFDFVALCNVSEDSFLNLELGEIIDLENVKIYPTILDAIAMIDSISASTATSGISNESFTPV
jgi:MFS superfamily sulfate permease-like transporter